MEKKEIDRSKWNYTKAAAYSGTIGLIVAIVYTVVNFIRLGITDPLGGFIGARVGQFFLIILGFIIVGVILLAVYSFFKKKHNEQRIPLFFFFLSFDSHKNMSFNTSALKKNLKKIL